MKSDFFFQVEVFCNELSRSILSYFFFSPQNFRSYSKWKCKQSTLLLQLFVYTFKHILIIPFFSEVKISILFIGMPSAL